MSKPDPYCLANRQSDDVVRAKLAARKNEVSPEIEDMSRRVREAETLTAADWQTTINARTE